MVFADAAHFVRGAFLGYLRCRARRAVPAGPGRQRYNVLGAVDAATHEPVRETNDGVADQVAAGRSLRKARGRYPAGPITVAWDSARHQHTPLVRALAAFCRIELLYLPPYSPSPNLIARVWRFARADALADRWRADFAAFEAAIDAAPDQLHTTHRERMAPLLAPNFQVLEPASIPAA